VEGLVTFLSIGLSGIEPPAPRLSNVYSTTELQASKDCFIGVVGFEPTIVVSKTSALPLGYTPEMLKSGIEPLASGFSVQHSTTELLELDW
jgi:hypothetical protein